MNARNGMEARVKLLMDGNARMCKVAVEAIREASLVSDAYSTTLARAREAEAERDALKARNARMAEALARSQWYSRHAEGCLFVQLLGNHKCTCDYDGHASSVIVLLAGEAKP